MLDFIVSGLDSHSVDEWKSNQDLKICMNHENRCAQVSPKYPWMTLFLICKKYIKVLCFHSVPYNKPFRVLFLEPSINNHQWFARWITDWLELDGGIILAPGLGNRASLSVLTHYRLLYWLTFTEPSFIQWRIFGLQVTDILTQTALFVILQFNNAINIATLLCNLCVGFMLRLAPLGHSMASKIQHGHGSS